jgi:hypothetical protein
MLMNVAVFSTHTQGVQRLPEHKQQQLTTESSTSKLHTVLRTVHDLEQGLEPLVSKLTSYM